VEPKVGIEPTAYALPTKARVTMPNLNTRLAPWSGYGQLSLLDRIGQKRGKWMWMSAGLGPASPLHRRSAVRVRIGS